MKDLIPADCILSERGAGSVLLEMCSVEGTPLITAGRKPNMHLYIQSQPRLTTPAVCEIGSGTRINPSLPEDDTQYLREDQKNGSA
jgi:hypothetical protein